jgi:hypothetical protein
MPDRTSRPSGMLAAIDLHGCKFAPLADPDTSRKSAGTAGGQTAARRPTVRCPTRCRYSTGQIGLSSVRARSGTGPRTRS